MIERLPIPKHDKYDVGTIECLASMVEGYCFRAFELEGKGLEVGVKYPGGCLELFNGFIEVADYLDNAYMAATSLHGPQGGVYDYEMSWTFGVRIAELLQNEVSWRLGVRIAELLQNNKLNKESVRAEADELICEYFGIKKEA